MANRKCLFTDTEVNEMLSFIQDEIDCQKLSYPNHKRAWINKVLVIRDSVLDKWWYRWYCPATENMFSDEFNFWNIIMNMDCVVIEV